MFVKSHEKTCVRRPLSAIAIGLPTLTAVSVQITHGEIVFSRVAICPERHIFARGGDLNPESSDYSDVNLDLDPSYWM